jgi:hypothetical protein
VALLAAAGCVTTQTPLEAPRLAPKHTRKIIAPRPAAVAVAGVTRGLYAGVAVLGEVPYDDMTLPLVSPDGRHLATQRGSAPDWQTLLAMPDSSVPETVGVEVYRLDPGTGEARAIFGLPEPLLLGRCADAGGFLVESPRADSSRWIGYVPWSGGEVRWLVHDQQVNAFGSPGPQGRLAWSRRAVGVSNFDLVVRAAGQDRVVGAQGGDWLLPVWSPGGQGLYALRLEEGRLDLVFLDDAPGGRGPRPLGRLPLSQQATMLDAWQAMASGPFSSGPSGYGGEHLIFWHPSAKRMALWRPVSSPDTALLLAAGTFSAVIDRSGLALASTPNHLLAQRPDDPQDVHLLLAGAHALRPVGDERWPYVLLRPLDRGRIELTALRLHAEP